MKSKKKILRIVSSLNPKHGGPSVGIIESSKYLIKNGFKVDIVTLDKQKGLNPKFKNIKIINFSDYLGSNYRFSFKAYMWLFKSRIHYDFFIIHGLWQFQTLLARLLLKGRYLVFTKVLFKFFFSCSEVKIILLAFCKF